MFLLRDLVSPRTWLAMAQHLAGLLLGFVAIFIITFGLGFGPAGCSSRWSGSRCWA